MPPVPPDTEGGELFPPVEMRRLLFRFSCHRLLSCHFYFKICYLLLCSSKRRTAQSKNESLIFVLFE
jgi:hypothetical protein